MTRAVLIVLALLSATLCARSIWQLGQLAQARLDPPTMLDVLPAPSEALVVCRLRLAACPAKQRAVEVYLMAGDGRSALALPACCPEGSR